MDVVVSKQFTSAHDVMIIAMPISTIDLLLLLLLPTLLLFSLRGRIFTVFTPSPPHSRAFHSPP